MRKHLAAITAVLLLLACSAAFAQEKASQDVYVKTIPIAKIYTHPLGYRILYFKSDLQYGEIYVPITWFSWSGQGRANVVWGQTREFPYLTIYYADGTFDHIKLYLQSNMHHISWGTMDPGLDLSAKFNVQEPPKDF